MAVTVVASVKKLLQTGTTGLVGEPRVGAVELSKEGTSRYRVRVVCRREKKEAMGWINKKSNKKD